MADEHDEYCEPGHGPPSWTPLLFLLVFFLILFFTVFPPKGPRVNIYQFPEKINSVSDAVEFVNRESKNPASIKKLAGFKESVYSDGDTPSVQEDLLEDEYKRVAMQDFVVVVDYQFAKSYLEKILGYLEKQSGEIWGKGITNLYLYDDRFVGLKNNVFSLSGGTIFFGASVVLGAQNEAEIAAVLSHERGHVILRHNALKRKIMKNVTFLEHKFAKNGNLGGQQVLLLAKAKILGFWEVDGELHKSQEAQADNIGQLILRKCGYDDLASVKLLPKIAKIYLVTDQMVLENIRNRVADMNQDSTDFKQATGYKGKDFIVSSPEEFKAIQNNFRKFLSNP